MDIIGKIYPPSLKGHSFMLVATEYFTKFMEVIPLKTVNQQSIIDFITKYIIYRFRIIESITTNQGTIFTGEEIQAFT